MLGCRLAYSMCRTATLQLKSWCGGHRLFQRNLTLHNLPSLIVKSNVLIELSLLAVTENFYHLDFKSVHSYKLGIARKCVLEAKFCDLQTWINCIQTNSYSGKDNVCSRSFSGLEISNKSLAEIVLSKGLRCEILFLPWDGWVFPVMWKPIHICKCRS